MKKEILFSLLILLNIPHMHSQNWEWSKKISGINNTYNSRGLFTDNNGLIYSYGSLHFEHNSSSSGMLTDTIGSFLQCYSATGDLIFSKRWAQPFYVTKMVEDGGNYIYFSATFYGSQNINGINISSEGEGDGAIGKMDLTGNIIWISTFGGSGMDFCMGICYNPSDHNLYATGAVKSSLYFDHSYVSTGQQSGIICSYDISGTLLQHKLYDYVPERDVSNANRGLEIACNHSGEMYVLMDHDGKNWWIPDTVTAPLIGRYIMKLNSSLDTIWSKYIIGPSCYYGYDCSSLNVASSGDVYIPSVCGSHFGGYAQIRRLRSTDGKVVWNYPNNDGNYKDIYIDSNTVYVIGTEGANGCPCESSTEGYNIVKIFDENNTLLGETRAKAYFLFITKGISEIYINGWFRRPSCMLGPDVIIADSLFNSGTFYDYRGNFLSKFGSANCVAPVVTSNAVGVYGQFYTLCPGDTAVLTSNCTTGTFLWSNFITTPQSYAATTGLFYVMNTQPGGCVAYSLPVEVDVNQNDHSHMICQVSYDSISRKNKIIVKPDDSGQSYDINEIRLYKEVDQQISYIERHTATSMSNIEIFIDSTSNPFSESVSYFIETIDNCGTTSPKSIEHVTMLLNAVTVNGGQTVLSWNLYSGFPVVKYYIWRGDSQSHIILYDSVSNSSNSYIDANSSANYYYQIEAKNSSYGCYYSGAFYRSSRSNFANASVALSIASNAPSRDHIMDVYPNPAQNTFTIYCRSDKSCMLNVRVYNTMGETVYSDNMKNFSGEYNKMIDMEKQSKGIYFLEVGFENEWTKRKVVLQ